MSSAAPVNRLIAEPLLTAAACDSILDIVQQQHADGTQVWRDGTVAVPNRGAGLETDLGLRSCELVPLTDPDAMALLEDAAQRIAAAHFGFDVSGFRVEDRVAVMRYRVGGHFAWHSDVGPVGTVTATRKLSFSVQLSDPASYDGGDLQIALYHLADPAAAQLAVQLRGRGRMLVFPAFRTHRVTPVTRGVRYALVGWVHGEPFT